MGWKVPVETATIDFAEDHPYHGAEATVRLSVPIGTVLRFQEQALNESDPKAQQEAIQRFGDELLIEWNFENADGPIPANGEGMLMLDMRLALTIVQRWSEVAATPPAPLAEPSANGAL